MGPRGLTQGFEGQHFFIVFINFLTFLLQPEGGGGVNPRQHCRLSICENWLSWTNTETAAATPPTVMQNLLRASAQ